MNKVKNPISKWQTLWLCIVQVCLGSQAWALEEQIQSSAWNEAKNLINSNARMPSFFPSCILNQEELRVPTRS